MFERVSRYFSSEKHEAEFQARLDKLREKAPVPVFWLFGKTQSGKTSVVKFLTGADHAEIGSGFRPCTRFSRVYQFPTNEAPLLTFLDTRGVDEPGYDPAEDLETFNASTHVVIATVKLLDHALENVLRNLKVIRDAAPRRPIVLAVTSLHEAYPQQQHVFPYGFPFDQEGNFTSPSGARDPVTRSLNEQRRRFDGLVDTIVPIDLTRTEEGFNEPNYGGDELKRVLVKALPGAYRQTLLNLEDASGELQDLFLRRSIPHIAGYSTLAATAGAIPVPWVDLLLLPGIQTRMIHHLAQLYGQPLSGTRFLELAATLGIGMVLRQAVREVAKFIPYVGSVAGSALAGASTFALGKAFCYYYQAVHQGHVPQAEELKRYYRAELALAERHWSSVNSAAGQPADGESAKS